MNWVAIFTLTCLVLVSGCQSGPQRTDVEEPTVSIPNPYLEPLKAALKESPRESSFIRKNALVLTLQSQKEFFEVTHKALQESPLIMESPRIKTQVEGLFWNLPPNASTLEPIIIWQDLILAESLGLQVAKLNSLKSYEPGRCLASYESHFLHLDLTKGKARGQNLKIKLSNPAPYYLVRINQQKPFYELKSFNSLTHLNSTLDLLCYELAVRHAEILGSEMSNFVYLFLIGQKAKSAKLLQNALQITDAYQAESQQ